MKTRNLLIAALLLGGMTAFNSCSEKEIDNITPPIDQPVAAEALETVLSVSTGFGNTGNSNLTRAEGYPAYEEDSKKYPSYEQIRNYAVAVFNVVDGKPANVLSVYAVEGLNWTDKNSMDKLMNEDNGKWGVTLNPLKFKIAPNADGNAQIAVVVMANCDELTGLITGRISETSETGTTIKNFEEFASLANTVDLPLLLNTKFGGYPMSSDVVFWTIKPGLTNAIGIGNREGIKTLNSALEYYDSIGEFDPTLFGDYSDGKSDKLYVLGQRIYLYRCWSQVTLSKIAVKQYNSNADDAKFELKEAFIMNVPAKTKLFADQAIINYQEKKWGGLLNISLGDYIESMGNNASFYSGWTDDKDLETLPSSDELNKSAYGEFFRSRQIADASIYNDYYTRAQKATATLKSDIDLTKYTTVNEHFAVDVNKTPQPLFNYVVSESAYGKENGEDVDDQAMVLVIKGDYYEKFGSTWVRYQTHYDAEGNVTLEEVDNTEETDNSCCYYTIVINKDGIAEDGGVLSKNITNTVMRNVQYEIDVTISGPGSDTPLGYLKSTYFVPKVTIVPFGKVTQSAERD